MPFLSPNQQCQSTEGKISHSMDLLTPSSPGVSQLRLWPLTACFNKLLNENRCEVLNLIIDDGWRFIYRFCSMYAGLHRQKLYIYIYIESDYRMSDQQWRCGRLTWDWGSSRDRVVMASRNCWCAAMMWSRSLAFFTRHRSSSHEHSSTCSSTTCPHHTQTSADKTVDCMGDCAVCTARTWSILRERNIGRAGQKTTVKKRKN